MDGIALGSHYNKYFVGANGYSLTACGVIILCGLDVNIKYEQICENDIEMLTKMGLRLMSLQVCLLM